jgi:hypothetical protein
LHESLSLFAAGSGEEKPVRVFAHRRCAEKVARRETSGSQIIFMFRALKVREDFCARLQRANILIAVVQTFHVWLPSRRRCRGGTLQTFHVWLPSRRRCRGGTLQTFHVWLTCVRVGDAQKFTPYPFPLFPRL